MFNCNYPLRKVFVFGGAILSFFLLSEHFGALPALLPAASFANKTFSSISSSANDSISSNLTSEWQCEESQIKVNGSSLLDAEMLMKDTARNGTSIHNASLDYNDFDTCHEVGKRLQPRPFPILVHVFYPFGEGIDPRKKHLSILSFLATQCSQNSKLFVWYRENDTIPSMLDMPEHYQHRIDVRPFGVQDIKVMNFPNNNTTQRLIYEWQHSHMAGTTDVARVTILYNHGGIWIDSDVLLLRNLSPLSHLDFIYQAQVNFLNGAVMGAATKQSSFIRNMVEYMDTHLVQNPNDTNYFKWAHTMFHNILKQGGEMPFLPGCLFDGAWFMQDWSQPTASGWDAFFGQGASERQVQYINPTIARFGGPLTYHWHGRWSVSIVEGSLADRADKLYRKMLGIPLHNKTNVSGA